jgi:cobalt-zinc-cadmium efflux system outer membrane protein
MAHTGSSRLVLLAALLALAAVGAATMASEESGQDRPRPGSQPPTIDPPPPAGIGLEDEKRTPDTGMTLDQAVERLLEENLDLRAAHHEIAMAQADVEAAGQPPRDDLLIGIGAGGIATWLSRPRELIPGRWVETLVARAARRVLEAQYQDAVRTRIDALYSAFVDVQEAQMRVQSAQASLRATVGMLRMVEQLHERGQIATSDLAQLKTACEVAKSSLGVADTSLRKSNLVLANLLNLPDTEAEGLKVRSEPDEPTARVPDAPPAEELIRRALIHRPDLRAHRLGLGLARLDWLKVLLEPLSQIAVRPWPDRLDWVGPRRVGNAPGGLGAVVTLPTPIRNQGRLKRAAIHVAQARTEVAKVEREVILDVRKARLDYEEARSAGDRFRRMILVHAREGRDGAFRRFQGGEIGLTDYLKAREGFDEMALRYRAALVRLRRSTLALNTAVGERILP